MIFLVWVSVIFFTVTNCQQKQLVWCSVFPQCIYVSFFVNLSTNWLRVPKLQKMEIGRGDWQEVPGPLEFWVSLLWSAQQDYLLACIYSLWHSAETTGLFVLVLLLVLVISCVICWIFMFSSCSHPWSTDLWMYVNDGILIVDLSGTALSISS